MKEEKERGKRKGWGLVKSASVHGRKERER